MILSPLPVNFHLLSVIHFTLGHPGVILFVMKRLTLHCFFLFLTILFCLFWKEIDTLSYYSLQLASVLLIFLFLSKKLVSLEKFRILESIISTLSVILIISATGGLSSPLFFLNFFLLFELSLLLEPIIPLFLSFLLILFYMFSSSSYESLNSFLILLSFPIMTPLALVFGNFYLKTKRQKMELARLQNKIREMDEELASGLN